MAISRRNLFLGAIGLATLPTKFLADVPEVLSAATDDKATLSPYSVAYNLQASRQSEFGEAFFPTMVVGPEDTGYDFSFRTL